MLGLRKAKLARLPEFGYNENWEAYAGVAKLADALDSKSSGVHPPCGFNSLLRHHEGVEAESSASRGRKVSAANDSMKYPKRR